VNGRERARTGSAATLTAMRIAARRLNSHVDPGFDEIRSKWRLSGVSHDGVRQAARPPFRATGHPS
jgi:hypothetical protein